MPKRSPARAGSAGLRAPTPTTHNGLLEECDYLVKLTLTEGEARWRRSELCRDFPDEKVTNEGVARAGTHLCNPADICFLAGYFAREAKRRRGAARTAILNLVRVAERVLFREEGWKGKIA
jgi:hypothetical protein